MRIAAEASIRMDKPPNGNKRKRIKKEKTDGNEKRKKNMKNMKQEGRNPAGFMQKKKIGNKHGIKN